MNTLINSRSELPAVLLLLAMLAGCSHTGTIRLGEDRPQDLGKLMETRQYERVEQLLNDYPKLDTPGQREYLQARIADYEQAALVEAQALESGNNLYRALEVIDQALADLPHNNALNDYRRTLVSKRNTRLRDNQRRQLLSRAEYIVQQQHLYAEQMYLDPPGFSKRWINTLHLQESNRLVDELLDCGYESMQVEDLVTADKCLQLARSIDDKPAVQAALSDLAAKQEAKRDTIEKKAQVKRVIKEKKQAVHRRNRTQEMLARTGKALEANDLLAARHSFDKIPAGERSTRAVVDMQARLDRAIEPVVTELLDKGDRLYRADEVDRAISSWSVALELDPGNIGISERLERASKVLARLEELKSRQQ